MATRILERNWRQTSGRVAHAWTKNHWIVSHRLGSQGQQTQDIGWSRAGVGGPLASFRSVAGAGIEPPRPTRAAESDWDNESGLAASQAP